MRRIMQVLPIILLAASLPALSVQPQSPGPAATHRTQTFRTGIGESRVREGLSARTASPKTQTQGEGMGRTRAYQVPKPGEGEAKGR